MMRQVAGAVARAPWVRRVAVSTPGVRDLAWRFVAGEDLAAGLGAARALAERGIASTLNHVGTHVRDRAGAVAAGAAAAEAVDALGRLRGEGVDANVSLKLTQIGLDVNEALCRDQLARVLDAAGERGVFVRIDMEESPYAERTLALFGEAHAAYGDGVGIVLQSYLRRTPADLERFVAAGASIRLVKGGYWETDPGVLRGRAEVDAAFLRDLDRLLRAGRRPAIATHDVVAVAAARRTAAVAGLAPHAWELQMLYGVREALQAELAREGQAVRCYVPYGKGWWPYLLGCLRRLPGGVARRAAERVRGTGRPS